MQVVIDNCIVSYKQFGEGPKSMVLIHGWGDNKESFNKLIECFSEGYNIVCVDLPGFGDSQSSEGPWTLDNFSEFLKKFLEKINVTPYALIGHSNGGAIVIKSVASNYINPEKIVLIASSGIRQPKSFKNRSLKVISNPAKLLLKVMSQKNQHKIKTIFYKKIGSDYLLAEHMKETFKNIVSTDVRQDAKKLSQPTILVYGDQDNSTPVAYGQKLHQCIKKSELRVIEGSGHFVHQQQPEKVASIIEDFIR